MEKGKTMTDYINREDAVRKIAYANAHDLCAEYGQHFSLDKVNFESEIENATKFLSDIPSADVTPVVRCKDCKFAHMTYGGECKYCDAWESEESLYLDGDFFCAFGERKDNE